jgi:DNA-binding transcriptional ArsR family regulator
MAHSSQEILFKVFGNEERVKMICCLEKKQSVTKLLEKCRLSQSAVSQHLSVLKEAKIIDCERLGKQQFYFVVNKKALKIAKDLLRC